jgi:hypothetical protein
VLVGLVVFGISCGLVLWAGTRPGYDPYGWLNWGYQTVYGNLDLGGAPSWKPLPYPFTIVYSLFGHYNLWMWMVTALAVSLSGCVFAGRIAYRLTGVSDGRRWPAIAAAVFAGAALLGLENFWHLALSSQSDTMIVAICLAAVDCHLSGHRRWAYALGIFAGLGRPETWFLVGPYTLWLWRQDRGARPLLVGGWVITVMLWFGVPTITNGRPMIAGQLAERSPRMLHEGKIIGTFHRFTELTYLPIQLAGLGLMIVAWLRRRRTILWLGAAVLVWLVVEEAFVLHGWPGVPRYMLEPAGLLTVLAGVAVGWLLRDASVIRRGVPQWAGLALVALIVIPLIPAAVSRAQAEHKDLYHERGRTIVINRLAATVKHMGGAAHIKYCGEPVTNVEYVSVLAYDTHLNDGDVGHRPQFELHLKHPIVLFTQLVNGWQALPWHTAPAKRAACADLKSMWIYTRPHPNGVLVPR